MTEKGIWPAMPPAAERAPAPEQSFWPDREKLPSADALRQRRVKLHMLCGRTAQEVIFAEPGYSAVARKGYAWEGWGLPVYHSRAGNEEVRIELTVPKGAKGKVRVFVADPDNFGGGRKQKMSIAGDTLGLVEKLGEGRWIEKAVGAEKTRDGQVLVEALNARPGANAVISIVEWVDEGER